MRQPGYDWVGIADVVRTNLCATVEYHAGSNTENRKNKQKPDVTIERHQENCRSRSQIFGKIRYFSSLETNKIKQRSKIFPHTPFIQIFILPIKIKLLWMFFQCILPQFLNSNPSLFFDMVQITFFKSVSPFFNSLWPVSFILSDKLLDHIFLRYLFSYGNTSF